MPLLRKDPFVPKKPSGHLKPDDEVFVCKATKEAFTDYEEYFQRAILCNSLVWSCALTGKSNLTFDEAVDSERAAKKRLGNISKALKKGLVWLAHNTSRGRFVDMADDVYVFASNRYFVGEVVEAIVNNQWCDCKVLSVLPPTDEEIAQDAEEEKDAEAKDKDSPSKSKKSKKSFSPPDHLFKYQLEEVDPDEGEVNVIHTIEAGDIRREKGTYTREKNHLVLKKYFDNGPDGMVGLKPEFREKFRIDDIKFLDIFAGPEPVFEVTKRAKAISQAFSQTAKKKVDESKKKQQGTLDSWVKGEKRDVASTKKQTEEDLEAEMRKMRENSEKFKEELKRRAEEARKRKLEEKAREKERKKEEKKLLTEVMADWKKPRDDLDCDDLKELPKPRPVHCHLPNHMFGDFLSLLEFFNSFGDLMEVKDSFPTGVTFDVLESAFQPVESPGGPLFDVLNFMLSVIFDLQRQEDEEIKLDKSAIGVDINLLDKSILGKDEDIARQIRSATQMVKWPMKHQGGQALHELHMNEHSITEILRLHFEASGGYRSDKSLLWNYQQKGGYRLSDDPGLQFRMDEPQILEALSSKTVYELNTDEKLKIMHCLMLQILSFATTRDEIDEKFNEYHEAKSELRNHQIAENKRIRAMDEAEKARKREERNQKKEEDKTQENVEEKKQRDEDIVKLTDRQREALVAQKEKEDRDKQKKEDMKRAEAAEAERSLMEKVSVLQIAVGPMLLGKDRAFRRFWILESLPGVFVEHDDDFVGSCLPEPTPFNPNAGPLDEASALEKVKKILDARENSEEKSSSDKENDREENRIGDVSKSYSKKNLKQKVLSAKNGSVFVKTENGDASEQSTSDATNSVAEINGIKQEDEEMPDEKSSIVDMLPWGACLADEEICPVHSFILPRTHWSYFSTVEELDLLIESLNVRGIRERELKEKLNSERERIVKSLKKSTPIIAKLSRDDSEAKKIKTEEKNINEIVDLTLRDQILEMEEKIFYGTLGSLKIRDRSAWQKAIQAGSFDKQCETLVWGGKDIQETPYESRIESALASRDNTRPSTPDNNLEKRDSTGSANAQKKQSRRIRDLACAVLQVAQMVDKKYLKDPLGEDEKGKKKRLKDEEKRKKDRESEEAEGTIPEHPSAPESLTPMQEWENSLMSSTSYAQLFIHLTTLESSIIWSKSVMNAKCRICRRKTDPEKMLLCDSCDRGHHMYCLKPKLKSVPQGDWYCHDCKPKERLRSPKKKTRRVFSNEEDDSDSEDAPLRPKESDSEQSDSEVESGDDEFSDMDEDSPPRSKKSRRDADLPKKTKKKSQPEIEPRKNAEPKAKKGGLSQLLGKRRCAAEANERIARAANQDSGNSSECEAAPASTERSSRLRPKVFQVLQEFEAPLTTIRAAKSRLSDSSATTSHARSKRRRAIDEKIHAVFNPTVLEDLLNLMIRHKDGWPFDRPITKTDAPDYHNIIVKPMDLGTIRSNIVHMKYSCNQEVLDDIRLVFSNCFTYNRPDAEEFECAARLEKFFLKETKRIGLIDPTEEAQSSRFEEASSSKKGRRTL